MPYADERAARLYYDGNCGSCAFFARAAQAASHRQLVAIPLDAPVADRDLSGLSGEDRFGSAHLAVGASVRSGSDILGPLLGLSLGEGASRVYARVPVVDRSLRWVYRRFWNFRRTRGCAAATFS